VGQAIAGPPISLVAIVLLSVAHILGVIPAEAGIQKGVEVDSRHLLSQAQAARE